MASKKVEEIKIRKLLLFRTIEEEFVQTAECILIVSGDGSGGGGQSEMKCRKCLSCAT
jgi:hypothetical protein